MGGAIPWRYYCREFGGRQKLLDAIYAAWTAKTSTDKVSYMIACSFSLSSHLLCVSMNVSGLFIHYLVCLLAILTYIHTIIQVCFEVQPISVLPAQLAQGSYDLPSLKQAGQTVYDINDNAIQAIDSTGKPYPVYQVVPYEGKERRQSLACFSHGCLILSTCLYVVIIIIIIPM